MRSYVITAVIDDGLIGSTRGFRRHRRIRHIERDISALEHYRAEFITVAVMRGLRRDRRILDDDRAVFRAAVAARAVHFTHTDRIPAGESGIVLYRDIGGVTRINGITVRLCIQRAAGDRYIDRRDIRGRARIGFAVEQKRSDVFRRNSRSIERHIVEFQPDALAVNSYRGSRAVLGNDIKVVDRQRILAIRRIIVSEIDGSPRTRCRQRMVITLYRQRLISHKQPRSARQIYLVRSVGNVFKNGDRIAVLRRLDRLAEGGIYFRLSAVVRDCRNIAGVADGFINAVITSDPVCRACRLLRLRQ